MNLLGFAERINPKRILFVSKVLGRHILVSPIRCDKPSPSWRLSYPMICLEPIVVMAWRDRCRTVGRCIRCCRRVIRRLFCSTRRGMQAAELLATFSEDHSHASAFDFTKVMTALQANVENAKTLIMVDDEASTGNTCQNGQRPASSRNEVSLSKCIL